ncbi:MAG: two-component system sensor histidine kinase CreC [Verrucomicrobiota bacterium]
MRFTRVTLFVIALIIAVGFYQLTTVLLREAAPQTYQATEEVMVDVANLLAESVEEDLASGQLATKKLHRAFDGARLRHFEARIFNHVKHRMGLNVYVTDSRGIVIFDSQDGKRVGLDFSQRRDVGRTLAGNYGARSTRDVESSPSSSVFYVAAPIGDPASPAGVLTVFKPQLDVMPLVYERQRVIYAACGLIGAGIIFLIGAVFLWLFRPIGRITGYARAIERGERPARPKIGIGREVNTLANALESMRDALENRRYVERYVHTLTHELKSPLAAIRGAAELLDESMPEEIRRRFLANIRAETARSERLINRLLELSAIESRTRIEDPAPHDLGILAGIAVDQARPMADVAGVHLEYHAPPDPLVVAGDEFIMRAAITNLLENAIDFSPRGETVHIRLYRDGDHAVMTIRDHGAGIPPYATEKIFERFYSLRHHATGRKGTGLGLTLVKEAAELHHGTVSLENVTGGPGTLATLTLPLTTSK